jgi:lactoylglutathione lyase
MPRWTHVALPSSDLERSVEWYTTFTPLEVLARHSDDAGQNAWLSHPGATPTPFVLVLVMFYEQQGTPQPQLAPFAHLGIELPTRAAVEEMAARGEAGGCLTFPATQMPAPIGYICMLSDPDGNRVEFSFDQGVYATARAVWGARGDAADR